MRGKFVITREAAWIDGKPVKGSHSIQVINPATEETVANVSSLAPEEVEPAVAGAEKAFKVWSTMSPATRSELIMRWAGLIERDKAQYARVETLETGKPLVMSEDFDVAFSVDNLKYFASAARVVPGLAQGNYLEGTTSRVRREPIGVVAGIAPWNYPLNMGVWKVGPALAAGNTMILKPASHTPLTSLMMARAATEAGIPDGVLQVVPGPGSLLGPYLAQHPKIGLISLTGDTKTGKSVMREAAGTVKRIHMELGGKAPMLVFDDAGLDSAVQGALFGAFINAGQDCTAVTRIYVQESVFGPFMERFVAESEGIRVGDPFDRATEMGPLISHAHRERVAAYVAQALARGAQAATGGARYAESRHPQGFYYPPTVLYHVDPSWEIVREEVFGPVVVVIPFSDERNAIDMANDTPFGLAASVWTQNPARAERVAQQIQAGTVWINDHITVVSEMPHGGFKQSGFGKDLSVYALEDYTVVKHVMTNLLDEPTKPWQFIRSKLGEGSHA